MIQRASTVGELAFHALSRGRPGRVTRVFPRSVYLRSGDEFILLLWGGQKSPMTVNILHNKIRREPRVGDAVRLSPTGVEFDGNKIEVNSAKAYHSPLLSRRLLKLPLASDLVKGITMLSSLYDVSSSGPKLSKDRALEAFVREALTPLAAGTKDKIFEFESYSGLIGRGSGFTPAGDDFVSGFLATFNYIASCRGEKLISIDRRELFSRTLPESAYILYHSSRRQVDEELGRLIVTSSAKGRGFFDELLALGRRGHTSGIDMSLGVLLCEAAVSDAGDRGSALAECLKAMWNS